VFLIGVFDRCFDRLCIGPFVLMWEVLHAIMSSYINFWDERCRTGFELKSDILK